MTNPVEKIEEVDVSTAPDPVPKKPYKPKGDMFADPEAQYRCLSCCSLLNNENVSMHFRGQI